MQNLVRFKLEISGKAGSTTQATGGDTRSDKRGGGGGKRALKNTHKITISTSGENQGTMAHAGQTLLPVEYHPYTQTLFFQRDYTHEVAIRLFSVKMAKLTVFLPLSC